MIGNRTAPNNVRKFTVRFHKNELPTGPGEKTRRSRLHGGKVAGKSLWLYDRMRKPRSKIKSPLVKKSSRGVRWVGSLNWILRSAHRRQRRRLQEQESA